MSVEPKNTAMLIATDSPPAFGTLTGTRKAGNADDAALVEAVRRNAPGSREAVYHRYKRRVFALAARIAGAGDAEEVVQEAFIRIFRGLARFRGDAALGTWIYRLAVNAALSHRSRRPPVGDSLDQRGNEALLEGGALESGPPSGDAVLRRRLERGLALLPVGYRTAVVLHDIDGLEHEEIAQVLGCHVGTSKSQLHKARARLREILAADGLHGAAADSTGGGGNVREMQGAGQGEGGEGGDAGGGNRRGAGRAELPPLAPPGRNGDSR